MTEANQIRTWTLYVNEDGELSSDRFQDCDDKTMSFIERRHLDEALEEIEARKQSYSELDTWNILLSEKLAAAEAKIEDMTKNCISLSLHESRMKDVEDREAELLKALEKIEQYFCACSVDDEIIPQVVAREAILANKKARGAV